jgi:hypothetical protein
MKVAEKTTLVRLDVCDVKPMQQKMVTFEALDQRMIFSPGNVLSLGDGGDRERCKKNKAEAQGTGKQTTDFHGEETT